MLGKHGEQGAREVFNTSLIIQFLLAVTIVLLTEVFGMWYLHHKMVIPGMRMSAAESIFHLSIFSFFLIVMQAPFTAAVMAHERMDFFALISVLDAVLKLVIVFILPFFSYDKLVVYGILLSVISIIDLFSYVIYTKAHFIEIHFSFRFNRKLFRQMITFSGWNIFGSFAGVMKEQGINLILNLFYGPVVNAARGVASQVNNGLLNFVSNITVPIRPQVIQSYAKEDYTRTVKLTYTVSKLSCCVLYLISLPVFLEIDYLLHLWLGTDVPNHTQSFIFIVVLVSFVNILNGAVSTIIHASGKTKNYQIITSSISLVCVPAAYYVLKWGFSPEIALSMTFIFSAISQYASLCILQTVIKISKLDYFIQVIVPLLVLILSTVLFPFLIRIFVPQSFMRLCLVGIVSVIAVSIGIYYFVLNKKEKDILLNLIKSRMR